MKKSKAKIQPLKQKKRWLRMLVYGDPGSGKTALLGTSPNCLILNADGADGTDSAMVLGSKADEMEISNYKDLKYAFEFLKHEKHSYDWVWFDSVTLFQDKGMDDIMRELLVKSPHRDADIPDVKEYLRNMNRLNRWLRNMKTLPINLGLTAHEMRIEDEDGDVTYMPLIAGKNMPTKWCGNMSIVGHLIPKKAKGGKEKEVAWRGNVLTTVRTGKWYGKDRFNALGGRMYNPTIPKIIAAIKVSVNKTKEN